MKKILFILSAILLVNAASAQKHEKNILGVRGGMNVSSVTVSLEGLSETSDSRIGYYIGISDQILLSKRLPFYLDLGLSFSSRGGKGDGVSLRTMYIQIPVLLNYHFNIKNVVTIQPFAGLYYGAGIAGKVKVDRVKANIFGDEGVFERSDFGVRMGAGVVWKRIYFGLSYDIGCMNLLRSEASELFDDDFGYGAKIRNDCFTLSIGYNF